VKGLKSKFDLQNEANFCDVVAVMRDPQPSVACRYQAGYAGGLLRCVHDTGLWKRATAS
jgi:hypothetical protein